MLYRGNICQRVLYLPFTAGGQFTDQDTKLTMEKCLMTLFWASSAVSILYNTDQRKKKEQNYEYRLSSRMMLKSTHFNVKCRSFWTQLTFKYVICCDMIRNAVQVPLSRSRQPRRVESRDTEAENEWGKDSDSHFSPSFIIMNRWTRKCKSRA